MPDPGTVPLVDPEGVPRDVPLADAAGLLTSGWHAQTSADTSRLATEQAREQDYEGVGGGLRSAAEGAARGVFFGLSDVALRAAGVPARDLRERSDRNRGLAIGGEVLGGLVPSVVAPGSLLARNPAGVAAGIGRQIVEEAGEGALRRVGAATTAGAVEGALAGGGQYLSQVALEDQPLAAEGFIGGMGKGALWGAPIGGALGLGEQTLIRARSLFPKEEVTRQAARQVDRQATDAVSQAVRDSDQMVEIAKRRIAVAGAREQAAGEMEGATRAMFGAADDATLQNQVVQAAEQQQLTEAVNRVERARSELEDWIRTEADPDLEAALLRIRAPNVQVGAPSLRVPEFGEVVPPAKVNPDLGEFGLQKTAVGRRVGAGTPGPRSLPDLPVQALEEPPPGLPALEPRSADATNVGRRPRVGDGTPAPAGLPALPRSELTDDLAASVERDLAGGASSPALVEDIVTPGAPLTPQDAVAVDSAIAGGPVESTSIVDEIVRRSGLAKGPDAALPSAVQETPLPERAILPKSVPGKDGVIPDLAKADQRAADYIMSRAREQGVDFNAKLRERGWEGKLFLGSLDIDWSVPQHRKVLMDLFRDGKLQLARADLVGAMDPGLVRSSEITDRGASFHFLVDDGTHKITAAAPSKLQGGALGQTAGRYKGPVKIDTFERPSKGAAGAIPDRAGLERYLDRTGNDWLDETVPASEIAARGYYEPFSPDAHKNVARNEGARKAITEGQREPISLLVSPSGKIVVEGGRHRLAAAIDLDAPIKVKWSTGHEPSSDMVRRGSAEAGHLDNPSSIPTDEIWKRNGLTPRISTTNNGKRFNIEVGDINSDSHGYLTAAIDPDGMVRVGSTEIPESLRGRGIGNAMYRDLDRYIQKETGLRLASDASRSNEADRLWRGLAREGFAEPMGDVVDGRPEFWQMSGKLETNTADAAAAPTDTLTGLLRGTKSALDQGADFKAIGAPAREAYAADKAIRTAEASELARARAIAAREAARGDLPPLPDETGLEGLARAQRSVADEILGELPDETGLDGFLRAQRAAGDEVESAPAVLRATVAPSRADDARTIVDRSMGAEMRRVVDDDAIERALRRHNGKNVDIGPNLAKGARVINDFESASADLADALGPDAPPTAASHAKAYRAATMAGGETSGFAVARAAEDINAKTPRAADGTVVEPNLLAALHRSSNVDAKRAGKVIDELTKTSLAPDGELPDAAPVGRARGALGLAADVGTAIEVLSAMGVNAPDISQIPVIGPVLSAFLKARAVLGVLGRRGGSISRSGESIIATKAASVRNRIADATDKLFEQSAKAARKAIPVAGTGGALAYRLFPGDGETKSKDPRVLYDARMDELTRASAPGAVEGAVADRIRTSDPNLQAAIASQARRGVSFLLSKAPRESLAQTMIPGDGKWHPSKTAIERWSRYVAAVHDPASVLEDLARGHVTAEGAEALRVVYPALYAEGQRILLERAPLMQQRLPYARRVLISIMYQIPVDGTMSAGHIRFLRPPEPAPQAGVQPGGAMPPPVPPPQPLLTAPLQIGQLTMTSLERRAGA